MKQQFELPAHQRVLATACSSAAQESETAVDRLLERIPAENKVYGIEVTNSGSSGDLLTYGLATFGEPVTRQLLGLNFANTGPIKSADTVFVGVPLGHAELFPGSDFKSDLSIANFGDGIAHVSVKRASMDVNEPVARVIANVVLPPRSALHIVLSPSDALPSGFRNSFVVSSDKAPGTVYSSMVSTSEFTQTTVQLIGKDRQQGQNGGGHPWNITGDIKSTLLLFNHSDKPHVFTVNIAAGGSKWQQLYTLASEETRAISVNRIIRSSEKDSLGKTLQSEATSGNISWFTAASGQGTGRLLVSSSATGLARNFSCGYNIVLCGAALYTSVIGLPLNFDSTPLSLGSIYGLACTAYDPNACSGQSYGSGGGGYSYSWDSSNSSITPISGSSTSSSVTLHGHALGQGGAYGFISNGHCSPSAGGTGTVYNSWADYFGLPNDGTQILIGQSDYNTMVSNNIIAAGAGAIVLVPVAGEIVILVAIVVVAAVLTYAAAQYISSHHVSVTAPPRRPCTLAAQTSGPNASPVLTTAQATAHSPHFPVRQARSALQLCPMAYSKLLEIANRKHMMAPSQSEAIRVARNICLHVLLFCSLSRAGNPSPPVCALLTQQDKEAAADFIYTQFGLMKPVVVTETWQVSGTCYTRLHFRIKESNEDVAQDFYFSPDHRFLTLDLFDVGQFSPAAELAARSALRAELKDPASAILGNPSAKVLISFFTDLQCPYCREQEEVLTREILPIYRDKIAIVFHHRPSETHSWSMPASEAMSCVQTQMPGQFWPTAEWVLENQAGLSPETATDTIISRAAPPGSDIGQLKHCAAKHLSDGIIKRDQALAKDLSIMSTPTTFVDGRRFVGAVSSARLKQAIEAAMSR